jgi:hypothetical protein
VSIIDQPQLRTPQAQLSHPAADNGTAAPARTVSDSSSTFLLGIAMHGGTSYVASQKALETQAVDDT